MKARWVLYYMLGNHKMYIREFCSTGNNHHTESKREGKLFTTIQANKVIKESKYEKERVLKNERI